MKITLLFTDNLISRNRARWSKDEIAKMPNLIVGMRSTLDHAWGSVRDRWGIVTEAIAKSGSPPDNLSAEDKAVVKAEGYCWAECTIDVLGEEVEEKAWLMEMIQTLLVSECSIGFRYTQMQCPNCECAAGDMRSPKCPKAWEDIPYIERKGIEEIMEVSFVAIPDVARTRILTIDGIPAEEYVRQYLAADEAEDMAIAQASRKKSGNFSKTRR